ncbi:MAG: lycopene cyclase domain-containing protein [Dehalococcoidia bacterium]
MIGLQWSFGRRELWARRHLWAAAILVPTLYLGIVDILAIEDGIWSINEDKTLPLRWGGFVFEEWVFFLATNTMVVQTILLVSDPTVRRRARGLVGVR